MRISSFRVGPSRSLRLAECDTVPRVMIIAGPNGCGKSTLLQELRAHPGHSRPLYVGPHRVSRRQQVKKRFLGATFSMADILSGDSLPGVEGIGLHSLHALLGF